MEILTIYNTFINPIYLYYLFIYNYDSTPFRPFFTALPDESELFQMTRPFRPKERCQGQCLQEIGHKSKSWWWGWWRSCDTWESKTAGIRWAVLQVPSNHCKQKQWFHTFPAIFHCTARRIWVVSNDQALQAKRKVSRPMSPRDWPQIKVP